MTRRNVSMWLLTMALVACSAEEAATSPPPIPPEDQISIGQVASDYIRAGCAQSLRCAPGVFRIDYPGGIEECVDSVYAAFHTREDMTVPSTSCTRTRSRTCVLDREAAVCPTGLVTYRPPPVSCEGCVSSAEGYMGEFESLGADPSSWYSAEAEYDEEYDEEEVAE